MRGGARRGLRPPLGPEGVLGVVLAGGLARRMGGGDKTLLPIGGRPMLAVLLERLRPQVAGVAISANGEAGRFGAVAPGVPVLADPVPGFPGPLAGVLAGMDRAAALGLGWVLTVPGDTPLVPADLAARLGGALSAEGGARAALAASAGRVHPPVGLWDAALRGDLRQAILSGEGKVSRWAARHHAVTVAWEGDPFLNANAPEDVAALERALARAG